MRDQAGPLPAQPYILVLWATHIGRYAIKHSPSESARASEPSRAIVKVLGTLCEHPLPSPLAALSLSGAPPHRTAPWFSHPADHGRLEMPERDERERPGGATSKSPSWFSLSGRQLGHTRERWRGPEERWDLGKSA